MLTDKEGTYGMMAGEALYFYSCQAVDVVVRQSEQCAQELPVTYRNQSWYVAPFSRVLVKEASPIPCSDLAPPQFFVEDQLWVTYCGLIPSKPPTYLDPQKPVLNLGYIDLEVYRKKGIYTAEQLEQAQRAMMFPRLFDQFTQQIVSDGTAKYAATKWRPENLFDEKFQENLVKRFFQRTWGVFAALGNFISGLIGVYFVYQIVRIALSHVITLYNVYMLVGLTRQFILSLLPMVGKHIVYTQIRRMYDVSRGGPTDPPQGGNHGGTTHVENQELAQAPGKEVKNEESPVDVNRMYPSVHMSGETDGYHPSTNAMKVNGVVMSTGACMTLVNVRALATIKEKMTTYPYDGPKIDSATGHAIIIDSISEVYITIG